jgi:hypothetical protein
VTAQALRRQGGVALAAHVERAADVAALEARGLLALLLRLAVDQELGLEAVARPQPRQGGGGGEELDVGGGVEQVVGVPGVEDLTVGQARDLHPHPGGGEGAALDDVVERGLQRGAVGGEVGPGAAGGGGREEADDGGEGGAARQHVESPARLRLRPRARPSARRLARRASEKKARSIGAALGCGNSQAGSG